MSSIDPTAPLLAHAKRTLTLPQLPPYATPLVRSAIRNVRALDSSVNSLLAPYTSGFDPSQDPATACALLVNHLSMRRSKRVLCAYHHVRVNRLERAVWEGKDEVLLRGGVSGDSQHAAQPGEGQEAEADNEGSALSPEEEDYLRQYADLVAALKGQWTDVDLTGSLEPPRDLFIDVRVVRDAGEIQTEYGYVAVMWGSWTG
jgi:GINS complex subunit 1